MLPAFSLQDRLQRCAQRCQDKAQEGLSATPSQKEIDKAQKGLANCLADCAQVRAGRVGGGKAVWAGRCWRQAASQLFMHRCE